MIHIINRSPPKSSIEDNSPYKSHRMLRNDMCIMFHFDSHWVVVTHGGVDYPSTVISLFGTLVTWQSDRQRPHPYLYIETILATGYITQASLYRASIRKSLAILLHLAPAYGVHRGELDLVTRSLSWQFDQLGSIPARARRPSRRTSQRW